MRTFGEGRDRLSFQSARCVLSSRRLHLTISLQRGLLGMITQLSNIIFQTFIGIILKQNLTLSFPVLLKRKDGLIMNSVYSCPSDMRL